MPTLLERPSALLGRMDMSDIENVKDAQHALRRAGDDASKLAVWAATWGQALTLRCEETESWQHAPDEVEALTEEVNQAEKSYQDLESEVQTAISAITRVLDADDFPATHGAALDEILGKLEAAL